MDKYDEIRERLISIADRSRNMKQTKAQAEIEAIDREYKAYVEGVLDTLNSIKGMVGNG